MNPTILPTARDIHCLKRLTAKQLTRLPISFGGDQSGWTCMCGSNWLSVSAEEPTEAYRTHVYGS
jgi:hypothetical protein